MYCMHCLRFERNMVKDQRKCNKQIIHWFWCWMRDLFQSLDRIVKIFSLVLWTHKNIFKILSHSLNYFHIYSISNHWICSIRLEAWYFNERCITDFWRYSHLIFWMFSIYLEACTCNYGILNCCRPVKFHVHMYMHLCNQLQQHMLM